MYIYKTVCLANGKIYIGQCSNSPELSSGYLGSGKLFLIALKKYGRENFKKEVLRRDIESQKQLDIWEQIYIIKFNSCDRNIGYNLLYGSANGFRVNPARLEHARIAVAESNKRRKYDSSDMSKRLKGKPKTEEHKNRIRESLTGSKFSEQRKLNISIAKKKYHERLEREV